MIHQRRQGPGTLPGLPLAKGLHGHRALGDFPFPENQRVARAAGVGLLKSRLCLAPTAVHLNRERRERLAKALPKGQRLRAVCFLQGPGFREVRI